MLSLASDDPIAIVVPGHYIGGGILLYTAIVAAAVGMYRARKPLYLAFAATCLTSAVTVVARGAYYLSDSVAGAVEAVRWTQHGVILFTLALFVFVAIYTHAPVKRGWYAFLGAVAAVFVAANQVLALGVRFSEVKSFGYTLLPWGESIFRLEGVPGPWNTWFRALTVVGLIWAVTRFVAQYRAGQRRDALILGIYIGVLFATAIQGALIDWGVVRSFHWAGFAFMGLALLMGISLLMDLSEQKAALEAGAIQLREENERRRLAESQIRERAYRDTLTGLPNRMFAVEHLAELLEGGHPAGFGAVVICGLDHFKVLNDALSEGVGDEVLREVARRVTSAASGRAVVARVGGDEFMAILEGQARDQAEARGRAHALAAALATYLAKPMQLGDQALNVLSSMGIAVFSVSRADAGDIMRHADMALHAAKRRGRNNIQEFLPSLQKQAERKYLVVEGLKGAIEANELALHFQPQVDRNGRIAGAEALLRWNSARLGMVSPAEFIPLAEEAGLVHALGEWSLRRACDSHAAWSRALRRPDAHVSVNVSPWQLARPDFVARLQEVVAKSGIDPHLLTLEITESALLYDVNETVAKLREIRPPGVRIALDDFGTGYSSLSLLKDLPVDVLKIDQSFVRGIWSGPNTHLVKMLLAVAAELGLDVVAEGVETESERDTLLALGCSYFQGYFFSPPVAEADFSARIAPQAADERWTAPVSI